MNNDYRIHYPRKVFIVRNRKAKLVAAVLSATVALSPIHAVAQTSDSSHPITNTISNGTCQIEVHRAHHEAAHWFGYDMSPELYTIRKLALDDTELYALIQQYTKQTRNTTESQQTHDTIKNRLKSNHKFEDNDVTSAIHIILRNPDYVVHGIGETSFLTKGFVVLDQQSARNTLAGNDVINLFTDRTPLSPESLRESHLSEAYNSLRVKSAQAHNAFLASLEKHARMAIQACAEGKSYPEGLSDNAGMGEGSKPDGNTTPPANNGDNSEQAHDDMSSTPEKGGLSLGAIIGIVVGVLAAVAGLAALAFPAIKPHLDRLLPR